MIRGDRFSGLKLPSRPQEFSNPAGLTSMSAATPTLIPRGGHFPALLPPVPSRGDPKPPTFRGRSDGRINTVRDLAREMDDLSDEEAEVEGLVSETVVIERLCLAAETNWPFYSE